MIGNQQTRLLFALLIRRFALADQRPGKELAPMFQALGLGLVLLDLVPTALFQLYSLISESSAFSLRA
jgi:hypothetical protein